MQKYIEAKVEIKVKSAFGLCTILFISFFGCFLQLVLLHTIYVILGKTVVGVSSVLLFLDLLVKRCGGEDPWILPLISLIARKKINRDMYIKSQNYLCQNLD